MSLIRPLFLALALHAAAARAGETIAVLDFRSRAHPIAAADVSDRVREAAGRAAPDARIIDRIGDADYVIAGKVSRGGLGYRASLELRDRRGEVLQRASATAGSRRELLEAVEGATSDLLRSRADGVSADASTIRALPLPVVPAAAEPPSDDVLNLDADASVVVAWDRARRIEARGREEPDEAAAAWRQLAAMRGANPFKETAETRAAQWQAFADGKRAAQAQLARDAERLRKLLPLASVTDAAKIELLVRFATAYGFDKMSPFVALLPSVELRQRAELSLDCAVKEAHACVQLARDADAARDVALALDYLGRACEAGAAEACDEAGARWLQGDALDPAKAIAALQRGCDLSNAAACVQLARIFEEGVGAPADPKAALAAREKACGAGDGKSCRRLAGISDEPARIADLLRKACDGGDDVSCALASREPALVQRQLHEAAAGAKSPANPLAKPAAAVETKPAALVPRTEAPAPKKDTAAGAAMIVFGGVAAAGAIYLALEEPHARTGYRSGRNLVVAEPQSSNTVRTALTVLMGTAAVVTTGVGLSVLLSKPEKPGDGSVAVGVAPSGVVVSGTFR